MGEYQEFMYEIRSLFDKIQAKKSYELLDDCSLEELRALCKYQYKMNGIREKPLISVLLATYKTNEKHLKSCMDSILSQTYSNIEVLVYDDYSTDNQVKRIIESYSDKRIKYYQQPKNKGIAGNRNDLLRAAKGKYIAVMDHDDIMHQERLEWQTLYMELNPKVGLCGTAYKRFGLWNKRGNVYPPKDSDDIKAGLFFKCTLHHPSIMIRTDLIKEHKIAYSRDYISANDRHLYLDVMHFTEFHNLPLVLMYYRMHRSMTSKVRQQEIQAEQRRLRNEMLKKIGARITAKELEVLNKFVLKGRCRIKRREILEQVENILFKIDKANQKSVYFPPKNFSRLCAVYFIKRCLNACIHGCISSRSLLDRTHLPVEQVKKPLLLRIRNFLSCRFRG